MDFNYGMIIVPFRKQWSTTGCIIAWETTNNQKKAMLKCDVQ